LYKSGLAVCGANMPDPWRLSYPVDDPPLPVMKFGKALNPVGS
jgi:hypothetical protein